MVVHQSSVRSALGLKGAVV